MFYLHCKKDKRAVKFHIILHAFHIFEDYC